MQPQFVNLKKANKRIVSVTVNDLYMARILSQSSVDVLLVNQSHSNLVQFGSPTLSSDLVKHFTAQVKFGAANKTIVTIVDHCDSLKDAQAIIDAGATAVGIDANQVDMIIECAGKFPVFPVVSDNTSQENLIENLKYFERNGCPALLIDTLLLDTDCVKSICAQLKIPVIGTGYDQLDGHYLSIYDILGFSGDFMPQYSKSYFNGQDLARSAIQEYVDECRVGNLVAA